MRRIDSLLLILGLLAATATAAAQTGTVEGTVREAGGRVVSGATVIVDGTKLGAISRSDGSFAIAAVPAGEHTLAVTNIGYESSRRQIVVKAGEKVIVAITLKEAPLQMGTVEVRAERNRQAQSDTRSSVTKIEPRQAKYLPGAAEDVMRSLRSLPGVVAPNDFSAQLVVRGSGPDQNLIVIDDIEVFNPYRLYGFVSMFNPETVSEITLLTGGFPAKYGDRLSAVLDVTNREGEIEGVGGKLNASVTNANLVLEGTFPKPLNGGWLISGRRTYYDLVLAPIARSAKLVDGDIAFPNFRDLQFKAVMNPWDNHSFTLNALTSSDNTELVSSAEREAIDSFSINDRSYNSLAGLSWRWMPTAGFLSKTVASWYENRGETQFGGEGGSRLLYGDVSRDSLAAMIRALPKEVRDSLRKMGIDPDNPPSLGISDGSAEFNFRKYTIKNETSWDLGGHLLEFGVGGDIIHTSVGFQAKPDSLFLALRQARGRNSMPDSVVDGVDYYRMNAFVQDRISFGDRFYLQPGVRFDYYKIIDRSYLAPRISASYAVDPLTTIRGAFGIYYQSPGYEKLLDRQTFFDLTSPEIANLNAERATHYVLGLERMMSPEWQVRVEGYYKRFSDLIVQQKLTGTRYVSTPKPGGDVRYARGWEDPVMIVGDSLTNVPVNGATGEAYGMEILLQKFGAGDDSRLNGWLGYTLAWANRYREGATFPFNFDQRHAVNLVLNYKALDWLELGANFQFGSGFPYTPPVGFSPIVVLNTDSTGARTPAVAANIFGEALFSIDRGGVADINSARLPAYHRLDVRATFYADWWDLKWSIYLDVVNIYNHKNILSRSFTVDKETGTLKMREVGMLPILPTLGVSLAF
jgi:TonB dependent receptor/CarboxypepD_reg-like domain/TonB-dependent Receptor Plug Domain